MTGNFPTFEQLTDLGSRRAAAVWLERLARGELDGDDAEFLRWLNASAANWDAWESAVELWDALDDEQGQFSEMRRDALTFRRRPIWGQWLPYAVAASVAFAIMGAWIVKVVPFNAPKPNQVTKAERPDLHSFGVIDYETKVGQRSTVALSDGSKITLDTNSAVDVAYANGLRMVRLIRGQAFFDVTHDSAHAFRVAAEGRVISVLGTRFNVRTSKVETRILLVQGSIEVSESNDPAHLSNQGVERLSPGQELVVREGAADKISTADVGPVTQWQRGFIQFDRCTLASAIEELNRYTDKKLVIRDPAVASLMISGGFPTGNMKSFLDTVTILYPLRAISLPDGSIEIVRKR